MSVKRFYRSRKERIIGGVLGGLAEYLGVDPNLLRLAYIVLLVLGDLAGALIGVYVLAWIFIPEEPVEGTSSEEMEPRVDSREFSRVFLLLIAAVLVLYGISLLVGELGRLILTGVFGVADVFSKTLFRPWYVFVEGVKLNLSNVLVAVVVIVIGFLIITRIRKKE